MNEWLNSHRKIGSSLKLLATLGEIFGWLVFRASSGAQVGLVPKNIDSG